MKLKEAYLCLGLTGLYFWVVGYGFGVGNHHMFLPALYSQADPSFLAGDPYLRFMVAYHYLFNLPYAIASRYVSLPILFLVSQAAIVLVFIYSLRALCRALFQDVLAFYLLFALLLLAPHTGIEMNFLGPGGYFQAHTSAVVLGIGVLALFFERKLWASYALMGFVVFVHEQIGVHLFLITTTVRVLSAIREKRDLKAVAKDLWGPALLFFVMAALPLFYLLRSEFQGGHPAGFSFLDQARFRLPHHFILSWRYTKHFSIAFFAGVIGWTVKPTKTRKDYEAALLVGVVLAAIFIEFIFTEWFPVDLIMKTQFYRASVYVLLLSYAYFSEAVRARVGHALRARPGLIRATMVWLPLFCILISSGRAHASKGIFYNLKLDLTPNSDWERLCEWIDKNTDASAVFITPPDESGFHLFAKRRMIVDWKSNPQHPAGIVFWRDRLKEVMGIPEEAALLKTCSPFSDAMTCISDYYQKLSREQIVALSQKYQAKYAIFPASKILPFKHFHETPEYIVYEISPAKGGN